jgi:hypothetical protein
MRSTDFAYTTGGDQRLLHKRQIGAGAFGDVHEVTPVYSILPLTAIAQMYDIATGQVLIFKFDWLTFKVVRKETPADSGRESRLN